MTRMNGQWRLRSRPEGMISEANFEFIEEPLRELEEGETLIRNLYLAFEPDHCATHHVLELARIARPVVVDEQLHGVATERRAVPPLGLSCALHEVLYERRDVLLALA